MATQGWLLLETPTRVLLQNTGLVSIAILLVFYIAGNRRRGLHKIPGPYLAGYTNLWRMWDVALGNSMNTAITMHQQWGPLVRVGPNHVSVSDPSAITKIYSVSGGFTKTDFYPIQSVRYQKKPLPNLFSTLDEDHHRQLKRSVANAYSTASLLKFEDKFDSVTRTFLEKLHKISDGSRAIDMGTWLQYYAFDVIGEITFSRTFGFLETSSDVQGMIKSLNDFFFYAAVVGQMPILHSLLLGNPLLPLLYPPMEKFNPAVNFATKFIAQRAPESEKEDFMMTFERIRQVRPEQFGEREIMNHASTNVLAGSDTTAIALRAIVDFLLRSPTSYSKLRNEIDDAIDSDLLSQPVKFAEAQRLPYLQAVIKESMRLHPSVGMMMERQVPKGGALISGTFIQEGTIVGINPWVVGRDTNIYGDDADVFRPERWIEADAEKFKAMERSSLAFGGGSRVCIGKNISLIEISKIIPSLFREFDIALAELSTPLTIKNYWFSVQYGLKCVLVAREGGSTVVHVDA